jgi:cytochrome c oxidase cbb3-type subunit III
MTPSFFGSLRASRGYWLVVVVAICVTALSHAQSPNDQDSAAARSAPTRPATLEHIQAGQGQQGETRQDSASPALTQATGKERSQTAKATSQNGSSPSYPPEQIQAGKTLFAAQCSFCHGRDAGGGESGPDLMASALVEQDVHGEKIGAVVRNGRPGKGMPAFGNVDEQQLAALVAFIHDRKANAKEGRRRTVDVTDLQTGNAEAGMRYFNGAGGCAKCHSPGGDLAGIAGKFQGLELLKRMLYQKDEPAAEPTQGDKRTAESTRAVPTVTVTLPAGQTVSGKLAYRDEFTIGLTDPSGWYRSWPVTQVKFTVMNPLEGHIELLGKYTDEDIHNVLAYLQTLR